MKKFIAKLFIALVVLSGIPSLSFGRTGVAEDAAANDIAANAGIFTVYAKSYQTHSIYMYRGSAGIVLKGDGDTDLDLYVYDSTGLIGRSESYGDYEIINLNVNRPDNFTIKVVNHGFVHNNYSLVVR